MKMWRERGKGEISRKTDGGEDRIRMMRRIFISIVTSW